MCGFCNAARLEILCLKGDYGTLSAEIDASSGAVSPEAPLALLIPDNDTTTANITVGGTVNESLETVGDRDWYRIDLTEGQVIQVDLTRDGSTDPLEDPLLRLIDDNGKVVAFNDDIVLGVEQESQMCFEVLEAGTYFIEVASFANDHDGDYQLEVSAAPAGTNTLPSSPLYAGLFSNSIMSTGETNAQGAMEVRYYFAADNETFSGFGRSVTTDTAWTAFEIQQIELALQLYEDVLNVDFIRVFDANQADLKFGAGETGAPNDEFNSAGFLGFAFFPGSGQLGSLVMLNTEGFGWDRNPTSGDTYDDGLTPGGAGFMTILHEIGHAFGLDHPFESSNSALFPGLTDSNNDGAADDPFNDGGDFGLNQDAYTVLSYKNGWTDHPLGPQINTTQGFTVARSGSLMGIDIAVLQDIYGANTSFASGDDSYRIEDVTTVRQQYLSIWDTGGTDEITYSGTRDAVLDLRPATLRNEEGGGGFFSHIDNTRGGYSIAMGVVIENASSGSGDDTLIGNALANTLEGGAGDDTLDGGAGNDRLQGGSGNDLFLASQGADAFVGGDGDQDVVSYANIDASSGGLTVEMSTPANSTGVAAGDSFSSIERILGATSGQNTLIGDSSANHLIGGNDADSIDGSNGNDTLEGGDGADDVLGGAGDDLIYGGAGNDQSFGGIGNDTLNAGSGTDLIYGGDGDDTFIAGPDDDTIFGGTGVDVWSFENESTVDIDLSAPGGNVLDSVEGLLGSSGDDTLAGDGTDNILIGGAGADTLDGGAGNDTVDYSSSDDAVLVALNRFADNGHATGDVLSGFENATGSAFGDYLQGTSGANTLAGADDSDLLIGLGGNDLLLGGGNDDILEGGPGADTLDGGPGSDFVSLLGASAPQVLNLANLSLSSAIHTSDTFVSIENVLGSQDHGNTITGDGAANVLVAGEQADLIFGGGGADVILTLDGDDTVSGDGGRDVFLTGLGDDEHTGGTGSDLFLFEDDGQDVITDFSFAEGDRLLFYGPVTAYADLAFSTDGNGDAVISYGADPLALSTLTLLGVTEAAIDPVPGTQPGHILIS